jgi:hypothetical protein
MKTDNSLVTYLGSIEAIYEPLVLVIMNKVGVALISTENLQEFRLQCGIR